MQCRFDLDKDIETTWFYKSIWPSHSSIFHFLDVSPIRKQYMNAFFRRIRRIVLRYDRVDENWEVYVIPFFLVNSHFQRDRPTLITKEWKQITLKHVLHLILWHFTKEQILFTKKFILQFMFILFFTSYDLLWFKTATNSC